MAGITKKLVLALIKDDLIHYKLILGLNALGLSAENYLIYQNETIFDLMGYEEDNDYNEKVYDGYIALAKKAMNVDNSKNNKGFDPLALEIYTYLLEKRPKTQKKKS